MTSTDPPPEGLSPSGAADTYFPAAYQDLRDLARRRLRGERANHSLRPTELVHEVFLRLKRQKNLTISGHAHLLALGGIAMRRILVEHARRKKAQKRGGGLLRVTLDEDVTGQEDRSVDLLAFDQALARLARRDRDAARVVQYRFFSGLTEVEVAKLLGRSERWVRDQWSFARAWLRREWSKGD